MTLTHNDKVIITDSSAFATWMVPGTEARVVEYIDRDTTAEYNYAFQIGKRNGLLMIEAFCNINGRYVLSLIKANKAAHHLTLINHE